MLLASGAARRVAFALAGARALLGIGALVSPGLPAAPWVGRDESTRASVRLFARALGGRDLALGLGCLLALRSSRNSRSWVEAGALADLVDTAATLLAFSSLPRRSRYLILAVTIGSAFSGAAIAPSIDAVEAPR